ncbi:MAG: DUF503 domain-containing protein [bacterium]|nr:DUF503 domain-containing protein [bacterium]
MLIAAALIELELPEADTIKARRRVAKAVKDRISQRFNVSAAEVGDPDDRHSVCIGCVMVGVDPRHLRNKMEQVTSYVESLALAETVSDDIVVVRLDEVEELDEAALAANPDWGNE